VSSEVMVLLARMAASAMEKIHRTRRRPTQTAATPPNRVEKSDSASIWGP